MMTRKHYDRSGVKIHIDINNHIKSIISAWFYLLVYFHLKTIIITGEAQCVSGIQSMATSTYSGNINIRQHHLPKLL